MSKKKSPPPVNPALAAFRQFRSAQNFMVGKPQAFRPVQPKFGKRGNR